MLQNDAVIARFFVNPTFTSDLSLQVLNTLLSEFHTDGNWALDEYFNTLEGCEYVDSRPAPSEERKDRLPASHPKVSFEASRPIAFRRPGVMSTVFGIIEGYALNQARVRAKRGLPKKPLAVTSSILPSWYSYLAPLVAGYSYHPTRVVAAPKKFPLR